MTKICDFYFKGNVMFDTRKDAENALSYLNEICDNYGEPTLQEFYDVSRPCGITNRGACNLYWDSDAIRDSSITRIPGGWVIDLGSPKRYSVNYSKNEPRKVVSYSSLRKTTMTLNSDLDLLYDILLRSMIRNGASDLEIAIVDFSKRLSDNDITAKTDDEEELSNTMRHAVAKLFNKYIFGIKED